MGLLPLDTNQSFPGVTYTVKNGVWSCQRTREEWELLLVPWRPSRDLLYPYSSLQSSQQFPKRAYSDAHGFAHSILYVLYLHVYIFYKTWFMQLICRNLRPPWARRDPIFLVLTVTALHPPHPALWHGTYYTISRNTHMCRHTCPCPQVSDFMEIQILLCLLNFPG